MEKGRRLKGVSRRFGTEGHFGQPVEFRIHERNQFIDRAAITAARTSEQRSDMRSASHLPLVWHDGGVRHTKGMSFTAQFGKVLKRSARFFVFCG
jgi:hypothetical protein